MHVVREKLTAATHYLRTLFKLLGCEVDTYGDDQLVDALLEVAPELHDQWPSDEEIQLAFKRLSNVGMLLVLWLVQCAGTT
jgi:hypothetical protein